MKKSHPKQNKYARHYNFSLGCHAELRAILGVSLSDIEKATMFVARVLRNGDPALAKPCTSCARLLEDLGVGLVYYTTNDGSMLTIELQ